MREQAREHKRNTEIQVARRDEPTGNTKHETTKPEDAARTEGELQFERIREWSEEERSGKKCRWTRHRVEGKG
jgi:hypothetical protein